MLIIDKKHISTLPVNLRVDVMLRIPILRGICNRLTLFGYALLFFLTPTTLFAQLTDPPKDATELLDRISTFVIDPIIFTLFTAAFVVFVWGLVQFVAHLDNEEARSTGGKHMIWGIIGMVVMVGVNSIIAIIQNTIAQLGG